MKLIKKGDGEQAAIVRPQVVETNNNHIYYYADINAENILKLTKALEEKDSDHIALQAQNNDPFLREIYLHINSHGGFIFDGLAGMDTIDLTHSPVITIVEGICASAGTLLSVRGVKRVMKPNSFMLIHQLSSAMWGKYDEFIDEMENLAKLMEIIRNIYLESTSIPKDKLDQILKRDLYFNAKDCLKYGLIDEIMSPRQRNLTVSYTLTAGDMKKKKKVNLASRKPNKIHYQ